MIQQQTTNSWRRWSDWAKTMEQRPATFPHLERETGSGLTENGKRQLFCYWCQKCLIVTEKLLTAAIMAIRRIKFNAEEFEECKSVQTITSPMLSQWKKVFRREIFPPTTSNTHIWKPTQDMPPASHLRRLLVRKPTTVKKPASSGACRGISKKTQNIAVWPINIHRRGSTVPPIQKSQPPFQVEVKIIVKNNSRPVFCTFTPVFYTP